jgi:probable phosphoglycerate mutase
MKLALLRHGITDWNLEKRVQGRIDRPLSETGRQQLTKLRLPQTYLAYRWYCSPLLRARQSAELLGLSDIAIEPALIEMSWGHWEGEILKPLRKKLGDVMRDNESRGLDFCPAHKGIIRCIYSLSSGWDMRGESPVDFAWNAIHQFELADDGELLQSYQSIPMIEST